MWNFLRFAFCWTLSHFFSPCAFAAATSYKNGCSALFFDFISSPRPWCQIGSPWAERMRMPHQRGSGFAAARFHGSTPSAPLPISLASRWRWVARERQQRRKRSLGTAAVSATTRHSARREKNGGLAISSENQQKTVDQEDCLTVRLLHLDDPKQNTLSAKQRCASIVARPRSALPRPRIRRNPLCARSPFRSFPCAEVLRSPPTRTPPGALPVPRSPLAFAHHPAPLRFAAALRIQPRTQIAEASRPPTAPWIPRR